MSYSWYPNLSHFAEPLVSFKENLSFFAATYFQASDVYDRDPFAPVALLI